MSSILAPLVDLAWKKHYAVGDDIAHITGAWNGAAFDYATNTMHVVVPGGHSDGWNNQCYAIQIPNGSWKVTKGQTPFPPDRHVDGYAPTYSDGTPTNGNGYEADGKSPVTPWIRHTSDRVAGLTGGYVVYFDGSPASRHTYGLSVWLPTQQRVMLRGGACWPTGGGDFYVGWFDPGTGKWTQKKPPPIFMTNGTSTAYDKVRDLVYCQRWGGQTVFKYDPATDTTAQIGTGAQYGPYLQMCCDGNCDYVYAVCRGGFSSVNPSSPPNSIARMKLGQTAPQTWQYVQCHGDMIGVQGNCPGMEYDPERNAFVFWAKEDPTNLSVLRLADFHVYRVPIEGNPPPLANSRGVWGRFRRYAPHRYCLFADASAPIRLITLT